MSDPESAPGPEQLRVTDMKVTYGDFVAVERASFSVRAGECVAIIGPNGNGKSSIALAIAVLVSRAGKVELDPERRQLFAGLPVADNILLGCYSWTKNLRRARASDAFSEAIDLFPELQPRLKQLAGTLSGGQQQMVALARGLAARPKILVMYEAFKRLNDGGRTIILIEENPLRALEITKRALRVERGILDERVDGQLAEHLAAEAASLEGNPS